MYFKYSCLFFTDFCQGLFIQGLELADCRFPGCLETVDFGCYIFDFTFCRRNSIAMKQCQRPNGNARIDTFSFEY